MAIKKKKRVVKKKLVVKKKRSIKKNVAVKKRATKKPRKKARKKRKVNPTNNFYVAYLVGGDGKQYFYHGYNSIKKGLVFDDREEGALWYRSGAKAVDEVSHIIMRSMNKSKIKSLGRVKAKKHRPK